MNGLDTSKETRPGQRIPLPVVGAAGTPVHVTPPYLATAAPVDFTAGFHEEEPGDVPFRWMSSRGRLTFAPQPRERFLEAWVHSPFHDLSQRLGVRSEGGPTRDIELLRGWNPVSIAIPAGATALELDANKPFPRAYYPTDTRELAVQMRSPLLHADAERHRHIETRHANAACNLRELLGGKVTLASTPPKLGIDLQGNCNVKPPCVYCAWDHNKALEGDNVDVPFTPETLDEYGAFFDNSGELVNCSIGEPFMMKEIDPLLDAFGDRGKLLECTTNGQVLTDVNIKKLLGRNVHLYISLDAATPETYAKLRNNFFPRLLENVRRLVQAKGGRGKLPLVYFVFMPMRANVHEVDAFVQLCAEMEIDRLVLRPLNDSQGVDLKFDRAGYHFDYQKEILPFPELVKISGRVAELCRRAGVPLSDQMSFGGELEAQFAKEFAEGRASVETSAAAPPVAPVAAQTKTPAVETAPAVAAPLPSLGEDGLPACTEPWKSLYILRRGTMPCCYGGAPIAKMSEFKAAWNGPLMQDIRRELLKGRFHQYCFDSPDCPIVKKSAAGHDLSLGQEAHLASRRWLARARLARWGWPGTVYRACKKVVLGAVKRNGAAAS
jgi:pyruvate-formate lyase-activating enzyme